MANLYVSGHENAQKAQEKRQFLKLRGYTVTVYGPAVEMVVDTSELDEGCVAMGKNSWIVVGKKD